jgi:hypothetical protein
MCARLSLLGQLRGKVPVSVSGKVAEDRSEFILACEGEQLVLTEEVIKRKGGGFKTVVTVAVNGIVIMSST